MKLIVGAICAVLALSVAGCSGGDDPVMPDVTTKRLDIALSDIERAGFDEEVEVLGGGTFGVVDESNWTVCDQEPRAGGDMASAPRLTVDRTCESADDLDGPATEAAEPPVEPLPTPSASADGSKPGETKPGGTKPGGTKPKPAETFVMPALVGFNLQDGQDVLQSLGSYILTQTDATGMQRFQVLDSSWKICGQSPAGGKRTPLSRMVDLRVVKLDERCG